MTDEEQLNKEVFIEMVDKSFSTEEGKRFPRMKQRVLEEGEYCLSKELFDFSLNKARQQGSEGKEELAKQLVEAGKIIKMQGEKLITISKEAYEQGRKDLAKEISTKLNNAKGWGSIAIIKGELEELKEAK